MTQTTFPLPVPFPPYRGPLARLLRCLTEEAARLPPGSFACRRLPRGALVGVRMDDDGRRVLRIAREQRPDGDQGRKRWASELEIFLRFFGAERWEPMPAEDAIGVAACFREVYAAETRSGFTRCSDCGAELPYDKIWGAPTCRCAKNADVPEEDLPL